MDDVKPLNATNEAKIKDGYAQLAEKMDQVKNQVARMERKYDEIYQAVKEIENPRTPKPSYGATQGSVQELKLRRESSEAIAPPVVARESDEVPSVKAVEIENETQPQPPPADLDLEKLEDNPFV